MNINNLISSVLLCLFFSCNSGARSGNSIQQTDSHIVVAAVPANGLPVIDMNREYPKKKYCLQDIADITYIPMETNSKVLLGGDLPISYFSKDMFITFSYSTDDVYIFDRKGKVQSQFNRKGKGGEEYHSIRTLAYDDANDEIFILDYMLMKRCKVYARSGQYKRTLYFPAPLFVDKMYDFDPSLLLVYHSNNPEDKSRKVLVRPYVFISKKDGSIISPVDIALPKYVSDRGYQYSDNRMSVRPIFFGQYRPVHKSDSDILIADMSADTVFRLQKDKSLQPVLTRTPSIHTQNPQVRMMLDVYSEPYMFISTHQVDLTLDFENFNKAYIDKYFVYEAKNREFYEASVYDANWPKRNNWPWGKRMGDLPHNSYITSLDALSLREALDAGELKGELKQIAINLDEEDNQVLMVISFR